MVKFVYKSTEDQDEANSAVCISTLIQYRLRNSLIRFRKYAAEISRGSHSTLLRVVRKSYRVNYRQLNTISFQSATVTVKCCKGSWMLFIVINNMAIVTSEKPKRTKSKVWSKAIGRGVSYAAIRPYVRPMPLAIKRHLIRLWLLCTIGNSFWKSNPPVSVP